MTKYAAGDYVVHPGQGVCEISGIARRTVIAGATADMPGHEVTTEIYEMSPVADRRVTISYPVAKEAALRPVVDRVQAQALIDEAPTLPCDDFDLPQTWTIREHFMELLRAGDCRDALRVVKTMHERMEASLAQGKKPKSCYARIFEDARRRLFDELAVALDVTSTEAEELICARVGIEPIVGRHA